MENSLYVAVTCSDIEDLDVYVLAWFGLAATSIFAEVPAVLLELMSALLVALPHSITMVNNYISQH